MASEQRLQGIFREVFDDDSLVLMDDLSQQTMQAWDSFHQVKLIISIQEEFDISFTTEEALTCTSVPRVKAALRSRGIGD